LTAPVNRRTAFADFRAEALEGRLFLSATPATLCSFGQEGLPYGVTVDSHGNLYGTTETAGSGGVGSVWELPKGSSAPATLHSFSVIDYADGIEPQGITIDSSGNLYGTTDEGGADGNGTVWELAKGSSTVTTLYSFVTSNVTPKGIAIDSSGNLYGTTQYGGNDGDGIVWELAKASSTINTLYNFTGGVFGTNAQGITIDSSDNLYGVTDSGGAYSLGNVWELAKGSSMPTTLYSFTDFDAGGAILYGITRDSSGNLYGSAFQGGADGDGTVWELAEGSSTVTALYSFTGGADGGDAEGIAVDSSGNLYGTTDIGGAAGYGTVFELNSASWLTSTTTTLVSSLPSTKFGEAVAFTATVTPTSNLNGTPTGSVTFNYGNIVLGTTALNGSGVATLTLSTLPVSPDTIVATYTGAPLFDSSVSASIVEPVAAAATTTTVVPSLTSVAAGQWVDLTALVNSVAPGGGLPTSGTVVFTEGSIVLGSNTLNAEGATLIAVSTLPSGSDSIIATYEGTTDYAASASSAKTVTVQGPVTTTTALVSSLPSTKFGEAVTFTATVMPTSNLNGTPTGSVTFSYGNITLGTSTLNSSGVATFTLSTLPVSPDTIVATYTGAPLFDSSVSASIVEPVAAATTSTTLVPSLTTAALGEWVDLTALVNSVAPGGGLPTTGTVVFTEGSTVLGSNTLNAEGATLIAVSTLPSGSDSIVATYEGTTDYAASASSAKTVTITPAIATTTTTLAASSNPITVGQVVAFIATVTAGSGSPTGTVTFMDGSTLIGTVTLNSTTHQAVAFTLSLPVGPNNITATYNGTSGFATSSASVNETVNPAGAATTTTLAASSNPITAGQVVAFTATVTAGSFSPTGTVTFVDGSTLIGTVTLNSTIHQAIAFTASLPVGSNRITATYNGASGFAISSASVNETVNPAGAATTTALAASSNPITVGQVVAFIATVTAGSGSPTGTVTFMDGSTLIGTAAINSTTGQAVAFTLSLPVGSNNIKATYNGASGFATSSAFLDETVSA